MRSRRATESFTFLPSGDNGETEFSTEFIQGPFNDTMSDEEAHRLLSSGRTRSLPSIQRVIDRKEKQIAKKKQTGKSKFGSKMWGLGEIGRSRMRVDSTTEGKWTVLEPKVDSQTRQKVNVQKWSKKHFRPNSGAVDFPLYGPSTFIPI